MHIVSIVGMLNLKHKYSAGFVCVRGFERATRAPRPLIARLHFPASKLAKTRNRDNQE